jgi:hypothetical protein
MNKKAPIFTTVDSRFSVNLDLVRKIFGPEDKKLFKIALDLVRIYFLRKLLLFSTFVHF